MLEIMGEDNIKEQSTHSDPFNLYVDLVVKAYLSGRDHMDSIIHAVEVMIQSGLPCFKKGFF
jgi:phosphatidylinositol 4-kinase A